MIYRQFHIGRFRGLADVSISLERGDLALLVGLNESGKTTILRSIEAFDHRNDPQGERRQDFLRSVRNKSDLYSNEPAYVTAEIELERPLRASDVRPASALLKKGGAKRALFDDFVKKISQSERVTLKRVFPFTNGDPGDPYYEFDIEHAFAEEHRLASDVGARLVEACPFVLYFEDFTDRIPEKIWTAPRNPAFNPDWYDIVDGLFYNTDHQYSIQAFKRLHNRSNPRPDDAKTVMRRVNKTLNAVFTKKWLKLSGVKDIESTELSSGFRGNSMFFEIKVTDTDGTTYSVDERSKGALWYLSFLMKTEFRRKKMRKASGKPVFLIDEPASNLHSSAQANMLGDFRRLVEDTSVVYTTHSQYLVSLQNLKNTYVIRRESGVVTAMLWADYIREDVPQVSHYQPLANLLQLTPTSLDVPWRRAVLTEGPSDRFVLLVLHRALMRRDPDYVIYPGTSAHNLSTLISLNVGWQSDFRVLLDSDSVGTKEQARYISEFGLSERTIQVLPEKNKKIEKYFSEPEKSALYKLAFARSKSSRITKGEFSALMAVLADSNSHSEAVASTLEVKTKKRFEKLFLQIGLG